MAKQDFSRSRFKNSSWDQNKTVRALEEIFTSSKLGTQSRDSIPESAFLNPEIPGLEKTSGIAIPTVHLKLTGKLTVDFLFVFI